MKRIKKRMPMKMILLKKEKDQNKRKKNQKN